VRLGELFEIQRGSSPRPKGDPRYWVKKRTEYHWITIADLAKFSKNGVLQDTAEFLTEEGAKLSRYVSPADLLVAASGVGSVGKSSKLGISGYIYDGLMAIKNINNPSTKSFIALFLKIKELTVYDFASGSNWLNINTEILSNYVLALPPLAEQQAIVERVDSLLNHINALEQQVTERKHHAEQLMQTVLKEAFTA
jgi:type I restriction enzyme S subunit